MKSPEEEKDPEKRETTDLEASVDFTKNSMIISIRELKLGSEWAYS